MNDLDKTLQCMLYQQPGKPWDGPHLAAMPNACNRHLPAKNFVANLGIIFIQLVELSHLLSRSTLKT
jgi:hypothetical protein